MDAIPPALAHRVREVVALLPASGPVEGFAAARLARLLVDGEPWLGAEPALAEIGMWMTDAARAAELRAAGCTWLARFPSVDTAKRLAAVALDPATPEPVREQAIASLGRRELRALWPDTIWPADALQIADDALVKLADAMTTAGKLASEQLPIALRHVASEASAAIHPRAPRRWGEAIECFAPASLARVLYVSLDDIPAQHRLRAMRLVAATLVDDALPLVIARAQTAAAGEAIEARLLAVAIGGEAQLGALEDVIAGLKQVDAIRARARWHVANRGLQPTVRGLKVARTTATLAVRDRAAKCAQAADDLGALARFARHDEPEVYALWAWMVRGSGDPARARALVGAHPQAQELVRELYLQDLARRGRVKQLTAAAQALQRPDVGALWLAIVGRPFAALELAATVRVHTPELACARALACYRAGRADLTERILADDLPPAEIAGDRPERFPGANEQWLAANAPGSRPALTALATGKAAVLALAQGVPDGAERDATSLDAVAAVARRLAGGIAGATVYLAGAFDDRDAIAGRIARAGGRLVGGPVPGTDFYVPGERCSAQVIVRLERQGTRRLRLEQVP